MADLVASSRFYELVGRFAGFHVGGEGERPERVQLAGTNGSFSIVAGVATEHAHLAFPVDDNATVEAFHRAAVEAGYRDNGGPGERTVYHAGYYAAFVLDPDG